MRASLSVLLVLVFPTWVFSGDLLADLEANRTRYLGPHALAAPVKAAPPTAQVPAALDREPDTLSRRPPSTAPAAQQGVDVLAELRRMNAESEARMLDAIRLINARVAVMEGDRASVSAQLTRLESRLTAVERGAVQPFRSPAHLTDPLAAQVAGRQAGFYDQFGRLVQQAAPVVQQVPVQQVQAVAMAPVVYAPAAVGRPGLVGRLFGRATCRGCR